MEERKEGSVFNMGVAMLQRIDSILNECAIHSSAGDLETWTHSLYALEREINYLFTKDEDEATTDFTKKIDNKLNELISYNYKKKRHADYAKTYSALYDLLRDYEKFLRKCLYDRDMLIVRKNDLNKSITQM